VHGEEEGNDAQRVGKWETSYARGTSANSWT